MKKKQYSEKEISLSTMDSHLPAFQETVIQNQPSPHYAALILSWALPLIYIITCFHSTQLGDRSMYFIPEVRLN